MKKKIELPEVDPVELKPILGIRPGLFILLSSILIVILLCFALFVLPGLISDKAYIHFEFNAKNVAIFDGDVYLGSSEGSIYEINAGEHEFNFQINGADAGTLSVNIKKKIFFTLFHRSVNEIDFEIKNTAEIEQNCKNFFAKEIASWSKITDFSDSYHFPPLFSELAYNAVNLQFEDITDVWLYGALHITSKTLYEDYLIGKSILEDRHVKNFSDTLNNLESYLDKLYGNTETPEITVGHENSNIVPTKIDSFFYYPESTITMGRDITLGYPEINEAPVSISVNPFRIASTPVSEYMYALFVSENPQWEKANKDELIAAGLVDDNYLNGISLTTAIKSNRPIRNISYYAAVAYCEWLSEKDGVDYSLPTETEWYTAALSAKDKQYTSSLVGIDMDSSSPSFMLGQLWEITDTPYIPLARISDYEKALSLSDEFAYDDIIIKGGSYINKNDGITIDTIGTANKNTCSEYMGFRVVINE